MRAKLKKEKEEAEQLKRTDKKKGSLMGFVTKGANSTTHFSRDVALDHIAKLIVCDDQVRSLIH